MPPPAPLTDTSLPGAPSVLDGRREAFLAGLLLGLPAFHLPTLFHRHSSLQQIIPAANVFQESVDAFQDWLSLTEQKLAQLWAAHGNLAQSQEAHQQIQAQCMESLKEAPIPWRRRGGRALSGGRLCSLIRERKEPRGPLESPECLLSSRLCTRKFSPRQQNWKRLCSVDSGSCRWCQASGGARHL